MITIKIDENNDWCFDTFIQDSLTIKQLITTELKSFKNDWFLNIEHGINWFNYFIRNPDLSSLEMEIKKTILSIEGVVKIDNFEIILGSDRVLNINVTYTDKYSKSESLNVSL